MGKKHDCGNNKGIGRYRSKESGQFLKHAVAKNAKLPTNKRTTEGLSSDNVCWVIGGNMQQPNDSAQTFQI